jgi:hypothetical protein
MQHNVLVQNGSFCRCRTLLLGLQGARELLDSSV